MHFRAKMSVTAESLTFAELSFATRLKSLSLAVFAIFKISPSLDVPLTDYESTIEAIFSKIKCLTRGFFWDEAPVASRDKSSSVADTNVK